MSPSEEQRRRGGRAAFAVAVLAAQVVGSAALLAAPAAAHTGHPTGARLAGTATAVPVGRPGAPTHLRAALLGNVVVLHWDAPRVTSRHGAPSDYLVVWNAPPIEPLTGEADTHSIATHYDAHFGPGTYQVVATNAAGRGPLSLPVVVNVP
jgi:hypothetical protein